MTSEHNYLNIKKTNNEIDITIRPRSHRKQEIKTEFVLDIGSFGEIIGIEIINLKYNLGIKKLDLSILNRCLVDTELSYSYDEDADAFYLCLIDEYSSNQVEVEGKLFLDKSGCIIGFQVNELGSI